MNIFKKQKSAVWTKETCIHNVILGIRTEDDRTIDICDDCKEQVFWTENGPKSLIQVTFIDKLVSFLRLWIPRIFWTVVFVIAFAIQIITIYKHC